MDEPRHHDMGGQAAPPLVLDEHPKAAWEKRTHALVRLLTGKGVITIDEMRRSIENLGAQDYDRLGYYGRWIAGIANLLLEKGVVTTAELGQALAPTAGRDA